MRYSGFFAELSPNRRRTVPRLGNIVRNIGFLVPKRLIPPVLVLFPDPLAGRVVVVGTQIKAVNPTGTPVDERKRKRARQRIVARRHENRVTGVRLYYYSSSKVRGESYIPVVGMAAGGADYETRNLVILFNENGVVEKVGQGQDKGSANAFGN